MIKFKGSMSDGADLEHVQSQVAGWVGRCRGGYRGRGGECVCGGGGGGGSWGSGPPPLLLLLGDLQTS